MLISTPRSAARSSASRHHLAGLVVAPFEAAHQDAALGVVDPLQDARERGLAARHQVEAGSRLRARAFDGQTAERHRAAHFIVGETAPATCAQRDRRALLRRNLRRPFAVAREKRLLLVRDRSGSMRTPRSRMSRRTARRRCTGARGERGRRQRRGSRSTRSFTGVCMRRPPRCVMYGIGQQVQKRQRGDENRAQRVAGRVHPEEERRQHVRHRAVAADRAGQPACTSADRPSSRPRTAPGGRSRR